MLKTKYNKYNIKINNYITSGGGKPCWGIREY